MRDLPVLIWIVIVVIGVVSSIAKNARRAQLQPVAQRAVPPVLVVPPPRPQTIAPPVVASVPPAPSFVPVAPVRSPQAAAVQPPPRRRGLFGDGQSIVRGIIAAEVLGKPRAERLDDPW